MTKSIAFIFTVFVFSGFADAKSSRGVSHPLFCRQVMLADSPMDQVTVTTEEAVLNKFFLGVGNFTTDMIVETPLKRNEQIVSKNGQLPFGVYEGNFEGAVLTLHIESLMMTVENKDLNKAKSEYGASLTVDIPSEDRFYSLELVCEDR